MKCFTSYLINHVILPLLTPGSQNINILLMQENLLSYIHVAKDISKLLIIALNFFCTGTLPMILQNQRRHVLFRLTRGVSYGFSIARNSKVFHLNRSYTLLQLYIVSQLFRCFIINLMLEDRQYAHLLKKITVCFRNLTIL